MQLAYRSTRRYQPDKRDTLVSTREQAFALIHDLDKRLGTKLSSQERATYLCGRAVLYEALGDREMLAAAQAAYAYSKTAQSAALVAVALHHYGRVREAVEWYHRSYRYPHEQGFEIDIGEQGALLFEQTSESWLKAWEVTKRLKKRIVYAAHLPTWDGQPVKELQVLSEGGFGDLIINSRYLPKCTEFAEHVTVFVPPYFYENGFVDLARRNSWWPETKLLTECKMNLPSAGFFDLAAIFKTTPDTIPPEPLWSIEKPVSAVENMLPAGLYVETYDRVLPDHLKPRVGLCFAARAMETPIVAEDIYRTLSRTTAEKIVRNTNSVSWASLQKGETIPGVTRTVLDSWEDTAAVIANLDLVVSVDTAVAHLAASMGKPTWLLLSGAVDWKWGVEGTTSRWYKHIRIFRNNDWGFDTSVAAIIAAINKEFECQSTPSRNAASSVT